MSQRSALPWSAHQRESLTASASSGAPHTEHARYARPQGATAPGKEKRSRRPREERRRSGTRQGPKARVVLVDHRQHGDDGLKLRAN
jgi:hypothetical protein